MGAITAPAICGRCRSGLMYRRRRRLWMRLLPKTAYYRCDQCGKGHLKMGLARA
jgi:hypothetical protein